MERARRGRVPRSSCCRCVTTRGGYTRQRIASAAFPGASERVSRSERLGRRARPLVGGGRFGRLRHSLRAPRRSRRGCGRGRARRRARAHRRRSASAYLALRGAQERLAVARRNAENQRRTLEITQRRLEAGRGTQLDTERAKSQLSATLAAIPTLEATIESGATAHSACSPAARGWTTSRSRRCERPSDRSPGCWPRSRRRAGDSRSARRAQCRAAGRRERSVRRCGARGLPAEAVAGGAAGYSGSEARALGNTGTPRYVFGPVLVVAGVRPRSRARQCCCGARGRVAEPRDATSSSSRGRRRSSSRRS